MRNSILVWIMTLCLTMSICGSALAETDTPDVSFESKTGMLTISGEAEADALVTLMILNYGKTFDNESVDKSDVLYFDVAKASDGAFAFEFEFKETSGIYRASIADAESGKRYEFSITMVNPESYPTAVSNLNAAANGDFNTEFKTAFEDNKSDLGFDFDIEISDEALIMFQKHIADENLTVSDYETNIKLYQTFCIIGALNDSSISDIAPFVDSICFENEKIKSDYKSVSEVSGASLAATEKMSNQDITNIDDFYEKFVESMILAATKYTGGVNKLMNLLSDYKTEIGIKKSITFDATAKINGKSYDTIEDLAKAYNAYKPSDSGKGSSGGGGAGGTTKTKDNSVSVGFVGVGTVSTTPEESDVITATYYDIEGYKWATTAIIALTDLGILNGKGEGLFAPEDNVTREEFAKILVGALGEKPSDTNIFADVTSDAWYCGWVNRAAELGICRGIGNLEFGTGRNITREDMCQMIVNALKVKGYGGTKAELSFKDAESISDYAKDAVGILYNMGAVNGISETEFAPKEVANRAQAAKIVYHVLDFLQ